MSIIYSRVKPVGQHAALSENYIRQVKRKLYAYMNTKKTTQWTKALKMVTKSINMTPKAAIGLLKPLNIPRNENGTILIRESLEKLNMDSSSILSLQQQRELLNSFRGKKKNNWLLENQKVFLNLPVKKGIVKERNPKRGSVFVIKKVRIYY